MSDDVRADARRLLQGITPGPWMVDSDNPSIVMRPDNPPSTWDGLLVAKVRGGGGSDIDSLPEYADAEFIAAAPELVDRLLAELDRVTADRDEWARIGGENDIARRAAESDLDDALAVIARVREQAIHVDLYGGYSGPSLARTILNTTGGEK